MNQVNPALIKIKEMITSGSPEEARSILIKFLKANALGIWDTIYLSEIYRSFSELDKALKILGPELGSSELQTVSDDQLALQFRLAYMLQNNGARFLAERMFSNLTAEVKRRGKEVLSITPYYWRYMTALYLTIEDYPRALDAAQKAFATFTKDDAHWWGSKINETIALFSLHEREACELALKQLLEAAIKYDNANCDLIHLRLAMLFLESQEWDRAFHHCKEAERVVKNSQSQKYIWIYRTLGIYYSLRGDEINAVKNLNKCIGLQHWDSTPPYTKMMTYYWLEQNLGTKLPLAQRLATRAHITYCPASYVLGKCYNHPTLPLCLHFNMKYSANNNDCWVIDGDEILSACYAEMIPKYLSKNWTLFDLYSGVVLPPNSDGTVPVLLTDLQIRCLSSILGAGDIGISKWALIDFIYRQNFFHPTDGENRLKNLVQKLRNSGFEIKCESNIYSMPLPKKQVVILPMNHIGHGPQAILAIQHPIFKRTDLECVFQIRPSTAKNWIKQWLEEGIIESKGTGRSTSYHFVLKGE